MTDSNKGKLTVQYKVNGKKQLWILIFLDIHVFTWFRCLTGKASAKINRLKSLKILSKCSNISMMSRDRPVKDPQKIFFCHCKLNKGIFHGDDLSHCY